MWPGAQYLRKELETEQQLHSELRRGHYYLKCETQRRCPLPSLAKFDCLFCSVARLELLKVASGKTCSLGRGPALGLLFAVSPRLAPSSARLRLLLSFLFRADCVERNLTLTMGLPAVVGRVPEEEGVPQLFEYGEFEEALPAANLEWSHGPCASADRWLPSERAPPFTFWPAARACA
jgi:hypothetical protein